MRPNVRFFQFAEVGDFMLTLATDELDGHTNVGVLRGTDDCAVIGVQSQSGVSIHVPDRL